MDGSGTGVVDLGLSILGSLETVGPRPGPGPDQMELSLSVPVIGMEDPAPIQMAEILIDGKVHLVEIQSTDVVMEDREESDYSIVHLDSNANELDFTSLKKMNETGGGGSVTLWQVGLVFNYRKTVNCKPHNARSQEWPLVHSVLMWRYNTRGLMRSLTPDILHHLLTVRRVLPLITFSYRECQQEAVSGQR